MNSTVDPAVAMVSGRISRFLYRRRLIEWAAADRLVRIMHLPRHALNRVAGTVTQRLY